MKDAMGPPETPGGDRPITIWRKDNRTDDDIATSKVTALMRDAVGPVVKRAGRPGSVESP